MKRKVAAGVTSGMLVLLRKVATRVVLELYTGPRKPANKLKNWNKLLPTKRSNCRRIEFAF